MLPLDPWTKAAECDRAIAIIADPERRIVLNRLRSLWLALCNEDAIFDEPDRAGQFSTLAQIHSELMSGCRSAMH
jgi:hypothetical protein